MSSSLSLPEHFFCRLDTTGVISLSGEQADSYLQGQITANVDAVTPSSGALACHCDFKGKMWNAGWLVRDSKGLDFLVQRSALPECLAQLKKYGVFSKVDIEDTSEQKVLFGIVGQTAVDAIREIVGDLPSEHLGVCRFDGGWIMALSAGQQLRYLLCVDNAVNDASSASAAVKTALRENSMSVDSNYWNALDIEQGIAPIYAQTSNEFVPQMFNMQVLDAIDFKKGCYMGQEVVARTKYLGKNKRATFRLVATGQTDSIPLTPGATLEKAIEDNWRRGGTVVHTACINNTWSALAVLSNDSQIDDVLRLKEYPDVQFRITELPYELLE